MLCNAGYPDKIPLTGVTQSFFFEKIAAIGATRPADPDVAARTRVGRLR